MKLLKNVCLWLWTHWLCLKFYPLCYTTLLKNFAHYVQIIFTDIEKFSPHFLQIFLFIGK